MVPKAENGKDTFFKANAGYSDDTTSMTWHPVNLSKSFVM